MPFRCSSSRCRKVPARASTRIPRSRMRAICAASPARCSPNSASRCWSRRSCRAGNSRSASSARARMRRCSACREIVPIANWVGDGYGFENKEDCEDKVSIVEADRGQRQGRRRGRAGRLAGIALPRWRPDRHPLRRERPASLHRGQSARRPAPGIFRHVPDRAAQGHHPSATDRQDHGGVLQALSGAQGEAAPRAWLPDLHAGSGSSFRCRARCAAR